MSLILLVLLLYNPFLDSKMVEFGSTNEAQTEERFSRTCVTGLRGKFYRKMSPHNLSST